MAGDSNDDDQTFRDQFNDEDDDDCEYLYGDLNIRHGFPPPPSLTPPPPPPPPLPPPPSPVQQTPVLAQGGTLFVGNLHWWTTDGEIEEEAAKYGNVKEVQCFNHGDNGKSKGYAQIDFFKSTDAAACREMMDGHLFNGRPCVVQLRSSPSGVIRLGEQQVSRNQWKFCGRGGGRSGRGPSRGNMRNRVGMVGPRPPPVLIGPPCPPMMYPGAFPRMLPPFLPVVEPRVSNPAFFGMWPQYPSTCGWVGESQSTRLGQERVSQRRYERNWEKERGRP